MQKKSQLVFRDLSAVLISVVLIVSFLSAGKSYGSQEAFHKLAIEKDLAITIDLLYSIPGNLEYTYPNDVSNYDIVIKNNVITVYSHSQGKEDVTAPAYGFVGISTDQISAQITAKKYVKFEKKEDKITLKGVDG
jgi:hypothetical protein